MHGRVGSALPVVRAHGRFVTLDAMRGVAALIVVLRHFEIETSGHAPRFSYLAVDLFFLLSGFVLAYSSDRKFSKGMSGWAFMRSRVNRLYPVYALGVALSLATGLLLYSHGLNQPWTLLAGFLGLFGLPVIPTPQQTLLFPLNAPFWSIFLEFWVANLSFAFLWRHLHGRILAAVILASAIGLVVNERCFYTFDTGWAWPNFAGGLFRVTFGFYAGVALARFHRTRTPSPRLPSTLFLVALLAVFFAPFENRLAHIFELFAVVAVFPALLFWGAQAKERVPELGSALGNASYVAYAIHVPLLYLVLRWAHGPRPASGFYTLPFRSGLFEAGLFCLGIALVSWVLDLCFDKPARKTLAALLGSS